MTRKQIPAWALSDEPMPLELFATADRERIEWLASQPAPPPRWIQFGDRGDRHPMASMPSRAFYEWHKRRGRDIRKQPEREPIRAWLRDQVIARDGLICRLCFEAVDRVDLHIDHIRPLARGGRTTLENLQVAHARCNMAKGARWEPSE